jgi:hypothetical protein
MDGPFGFLQQVWTLKLDHFFQI